MKTYGLVTVILYIGSDDYDKVEASGVFLCNLNINKLRPWFYYYFLYFMKDTYADE